MWVVSGIRSLLPNGKTQEKNYLLLFQRLERGVTKYRIELTNIDTGDIIRISKDTMEETQQEVEKYNAYGYVPVDSGGEYTPWKDVVIKITPIDLQILRQVRCVEEVRLYPNHAMFDRLNPVLMFANLDKLGTLFEGSGRYGTFYCTLPQLLCYGDTWWHDKEFYIYSHTDNPAVSHKGDGATIAYKAAFLNYQSAVSVLTKAKSLGFNPLSTYNIL